jgi:hypothetical protein
MAAGARAQAFDRDALTQLASDSAIYLALVFLLAGLNYTAEKTLYPSRAAGRLVWAAPVVFAADFMIRSTNQQAAGLPLIGVFALAIASRSTALQRRLPAAEARASLAGYLAVLALGGVLFLPQFASDMSGLAYGAFKKARPTHLELAGRFTEPRLAPLILYNTNKTSRSSNGTDYTTYVNDGVALLRRVSAEGETVLTVDQSNPFPYAMGRKPAIGGIAAMAYNYIISEKFHPSPEAYFGTADIVMMPKHPSAPAMYRDGVVKLYEADLQQRFRVVAESDWWWLYKRR